MRCICWSSCHRDNCDILRRTGRRLVKQDRNVGLAHRDRIFSNAHRHQVIGFTAGGISQRGGNIKPGKINGVTDIERVDVVGHGFFMSSPMSLV